MHQAHPFPTPPTPPTPSQPSLSSLTDVLPHDVLGRIASFVDDPRAFALADYRSSRACRDPVTLARWIYKQDFTRRPHSTGFGWIAHKFNHAEREGRPDRCEPLLTVLQRLYVSVFRVKKSVVHCQNAEHLMRFTAFCCGACGHYPDGYSHNDDKVLRMVIPLVVVHGNTGAMERMFPALSATNLQHLVQMTCTDPYYSDVGFVVRVLQLVASRLGERSFVNMPYPAAHWAHRGCTVFMALVKNKTPAMHEVIARMLCPRDPLYNPDIDVNARDSDGKTVLLYAVEKSDYRVFVRLLRWWPRLDVNATWRGESALVAACALRRKKKALRLLDVPGVDLKAYDRVNGKNALELAGMNGLDDVFQKITNILGSET